MGGILPRLSSTAKQNSGVRIPELLSEYFTIKALSLSLFLSVCLSLALSLFSALTPSLSLPMLLLLLLLVLLLLLLLLLLSLSCAPGSPNLASSLPLAHCALVLGAACVSAYSPCVRAHRWMYVRRCTPAKTPNPSLRTPS